MPIPWIRQAALVALVAVPLVACSSNGSRPSASEPTSTTSTTSTTAVPRATASTLDPNAQLNLIPYNVGEMNGLPGGWKVEVLHVRRAPSVAGLPAPATGDDYVTVDLRVIDVEGPRVTFRSAALLQMYDATNTAHAVVTRPGAPNRLDGAFARGTDRTGQLVFAVPARSPLLMILDGQKIGTQRSVFQIDPPKATPRD